jgi:predicted anti-sigma-YlaC factor YlaD
MTADACREWRGALAAAALDRVDPAEAIALQAHLDGCASCRAEFAELAVVARALPCADLAHVTKDPGEPSPRLREQVVDRVASVRDQRHRRRLRRVLAVAAIVVVAVGFGAVLVTKGDDPSSATTVEFPVSAEASGTAALEAHAAGTQVHLNATGLDDGDWYWLWLTGADGKRVAAGTFRGTGDDVEVTLTSALPLDAARRIWVTDKEDSVVLDARI